MALRIRGGPHRSIAPWLTPAAAVTTAVLSFGPWVHSGRARLSSFEVARTLHRLDLAPTWAQPLVAFAWYFLPLLAAVAVLAAVTGRPRSAAACAAVTAVIAIAGTSGVLASSVPSAWAAPAALGAATVTLLSATATLLTIRSHP